MKATRNLAATDVTILNWKAIPGQAQRSLSLAAARALLKIDFEEADRQRMRDLLHKAQEGALSAAEREEIDGYERVGHLLDLLHSKARVALNRASPCNDCCG